MRPLRSRRRQPRRLPCRLRLLRRYFVPLRRWHQRYQNWPLRYSLRPSANSDVNLVFSRTLVDSFPAPYDESAVVITLGYRF